MDYSGFVFGNIKVLKRADGDLERCQKTLREKGRTTNPIYTCQCLLCGKIFNRDIYAIKNNKYQNCGCQTLLYDLTNKRFGKLTALKPLGLNKHKEMLWECLCDCGNKHITTSYLLRKGKAVQCKQCGIKQIAKKNRKYLIYSTRLHNCYTNIKTRCTNKKQDSHNRYVNRGITICEEWAKSYKNFQDWAIDNGYNDNLTIDRIDNNKGYSPDNCRWVDRKIQANNRRTNLMLEYKGKKDTLSNWSRILDIPYYYIQYRVHKNKTLEEIVYEFSNDSRYKGKI